MSRRRILGPLAAFAIACTTIAAAPSSRATTLDNRDAWTGVFNEFVLFGGDLVDPEDQFNEARVYLAVQRGAAHVGYEDMSRVDVVDPLDDVDALILWCPWDVLDQCERKKPFVTSFGVTENGDAVFSGYDPTLGEIFFSWTRTGAGFNGTFRSCFSESIIGDGWYAEWDVSLHGPTHEGWNATVSGFVGDLELYRLPCPPITARNKAGKVELAWSNEGETI